MEDYIDRTLISLRRQYSKYEVVAALNKKLKEKDIEIGKLKSEIDYLQNVISSDGEQKEITRRAKIEACKNEMYSSKLKESQKQKKKIYELRRFNSDLIAKINSLQKRNPKC